MPDKLEALGVFLVLLPGFCAAYVIQQLCMRRKQTELDKVVEALLFSFLIFLVTLPFFGYALPVSWHPVATRDGGYTIALNARYLWTLFLLSIGLGAGYAATVNRDLLLKLLRKIGVTERTARYSIWNDAFQDIPRSYLQVELSDGRTVVGYLRYYSDDPEESSIFLEDAAWVTEDAQIAIDGPGILLTKESKIVFISFLDAVVEE
jgi:Family of unknown function (DUF6338)